MTKNRVIQLLEDKHQYFFDWYEAHENSWENGPENKWTAGQHAVHLINSIKQFSDFRISNDTKVVIGIVKNLGFNIGFKYLYDAFLAIGVPKEQYKLTNGLTYSFD